jgi:hypothetical protein
MDGLRLATLETRKGFVNFQAKLYEACPICEIKHEKDQLYSFFRSNGCFVLKYYRQKQYKSDHKGLVFGKVTEISAKPKQGIAERIANAVIKLHPLVELSGKLLMLKS